MRNTTHSKTKEEGRDTHKTAKYALSSSWYKKTPRLHLKLLGLVLFQTPENFSMGFLKYAILAILKCVKLT